MSATESMPPDAGFCVVTMQVPETVPSLTQSWVPCVPSSATKKRRWSRTTSASGFAFGSARARGEKRSVRPGPRCRQLHDTSGGIRLPQLDLVRRVGGGEQEVAAQDGQVVVPGELRSDGERQGVQAGERERSPAGTLTVTHMVAEKARQDDTGDDGHESREARDPPVESSHGGLTVR